MNSIYPFYRLVTVLDFPDEKFVY